MLTTLVYHTHTHADHQQQTDASGVQTPPAGARLCRPASKSVSALLVKVTRPQIAGGGRVGANNQHGHSHCGDAAVCVCATQLEDHLGQMNFQSTSCTQTTMCSAGGIISNQAQVQQLGHLLFSGSRNLTYS